MKYKADIRGTRNDVLRDEGLIEEVNERAERGAEYARARAPVRTGFYRDSITTQKRSRQGDRYGAIVYADAHYAWEVEQSRHVFAGIVDVIERGA